MSAKGGPDIVRNGLVLYLDAANDKSYPGSGTVWEDVSGNNNSGSLVNSPTFDSGSLGSFNFDGVNDYVNLGSTNRIVGDNIQILTLSIWIKFTGTSQYYVFNLKRTSTESTLVGVTANYNSSGINAAGYLGGLVRNFDDTTHSWLTDSNGGIGYNDNKWHNLVLTIGNSSINSLYIDGNFKTSNSVGMQSATSNTGPLTVGSFGSSLYFSGNISNVMLYKNKALTASEVLQNYNATKGRFGL